MAISITSRVRNAMVALVLVLCLLFTVLIFLMVYIIEDKVFVNQMLVEQAAFERVIYDADPQQIRDWQPLNANIKRIDSAHALPDSLPVESLKSVKESHGVHEYFDDHNAMFIASLMLPNNGASYYLVYDVKDLLAVRDSKEGLFILISILTLVIAGIAVMVARRLTKSTLAPVAHLTDALQDNDLDDVVIELAKQFSEDEVGVLTRELAQALERVRESAQREYEFNRGVSHELRSPIQVAQSTTELLHMVVGDGDTQLSKPIARLQRSVAEMNEVAEAFLWLASDRTVEQNEMCSVTGLQKTIATVQSTFLSNEVVINTTLLESFLYPMPSTVLSVVLRSLVRNAAIHSEQSTIVVDLKHDSITVSNLVNIMGKDSNGFGIGLSIVQCICDRFDCELATQMQSDNRYTSSIVFA